MSQKILNKRSSVFGKAPLPSQIEVGEIAINFNHENPFLSILDSNGEIQKFLSETKTRGLIQDAKEDIDNSFYTKEEINNMFEAFDPSGEVDLDLYYTKVESDSKYQPISGMTSYLTVASAENLYQPKGNYLTEHQSLENYYTKSEADNKFLTSHQDLSDYALKSEIPDVSNFVTSAFTDATYAKKGEAPTDVYTKSESDSKFQPQSGMTDYALKSELPSTTGLASEEWVSNNFSSTAHTHSDLATKAELENYLTIVSASTTYARKSEIPDISDLATKSEIPDVSNFVTSAFTDATYAKKGEVPSDAYTKAETDTLLARKANSAHTHTMSEISDLDVPKTWRGTLAQYNNLTEIDNDTLYIITDSSEQLVTSGDVESMISGYTNLTEVQTLLEGYSTTSHTHSYNDLTDKPTIPSTTGLASEEWVSNNFSSTAHTHDYSEIQNTPDLSGFASLSDIPDTSNFITSGFCEDHYQAKGTYVVPSDLDDYALKTDLPTVPDSYTKTETDNLLAGKANSAHTHTVSDITDLDIPSIEGLASETWVSENFQPQSGMSGYSTTAHTHSDLATKAELDDYLTIASASTIYATKEELEEFTPSGDNYAGTVWTGTLSEYNNLTVIDSDTLYVITDANQQYVTSGQVESMTSGYTNLTEVQTLLEGYSTTAHTHSQYLTETSADTRYARVVSLTQAQYDALVQNDQVEQGVLYCIIEQSNS